MTTRAALLAAVLLPLALLTPAAAYADHWAAPDDAGDVTGVHHDPDPPPCGTTTDFDGSADANEDITRLAVRHTPRAVQVAVHFRDLDPELEQIVSLHVAVPHGRGWFVDVMRVRNRAGVFKVLQFMAHEIPEPDPANDGCGGYSVLGSGCRAHPEVDPDANTVRIKLRRPCLHEPEWVRVGVASYNSVAGSTEGSFDSYSDQWGTPEEGASTWLPPFGPEVPVTGGS